MYKSEKEKILFQIEKLLKNQKKNLKELVLEMENDNPHFVYNNSDINKLKLWNSGVVYGIKMVIEKCIKK
jgi:hypothetical protein